MTETGTTQIDLALFVLRVVFGLFFVAHGAKKVSNGVTGTAGYFASIGMKWPRLQARMAMSTEIGASLLFAAGLLTPLAAAGIIGVMLVAKFAAHRKAGFFIFLPKPGWEYVISIAVVGAVVAISGPGTWSLDHALGLDADTWGGTWGSAIIGIGLGVVSSVAQMAICFRPPVPADAG